MMFKTERHEVVLKRENKIHTLSVPDRRYSDIHVGVGKRFVNQIK